MVERSTVTADRLSAATVFLLHRWAFDRAERAENTAIAVMWSEYRLAIGALVVELARVRGHGLQLCEPAMWTGQHGVENDLFQNFSPRSSSRFLKIASFLSSSVASALEMGTSVRFRKTKSYALRA